MKRFLIAFWLVFFVTPSFEAFAREVNSKQNEAKAKKSFKIPRKKKRYTVKCLTAEEVGIVKQVFSRPEHLPPEIDEDLQIKNDLIQKITEHKAKKDHPPLCLNKKERRYIKKLLNNPAVLNQISKKEKRIIKKFLESNSVQGAATISAGVAGIVAGIFTTLGAVATTSSQGGE